MKNTLAAIAVLGAFAGSALASDVQVYGIVDLGLGYNHVDADGFSQDMDKFEMKSGQASDSRFGFKGKEDLGNGMTVGFVLENGIKVDTGVDDGVFFNRESSLYLQGDFGKFAMGRIGAVNSGSSSWCQLPWFNAFATAEWGGYSAQMRNVVAIGGTWDNMIAYQTPDFAGFKVYAQYAMGNKVTESGTTYGEENESSSDRYYAIAATYRNGPVAAYFNLDSTNYSSVHANGTPYDVDDSLTVMLAGSYNFDVAKVYLGAQYFDEVKLSGLGGVIKDLGLGQAAKVNGYSVTLSGEVPVGVGKVMGAFGFIDAESADSYEQTANVDFNRYVASVGYDYPFSKRTDVYAVASYMQDQWEDATNDVDPSAYTLYVGLRHRF